MRGFILALSTLILAAPAQAEMSFVGAGQTGVFSATFVGCADQADESRFRTLVHQGDKEAAVKFADQRGDACQRLTPGAVGTVEDLSVLHGTSCFRVRGEPQCVWVPTDFVGKAQ